jgi:hypothetical protein
MNWKAFLKPSLGKLALPVLSILSALTVYSIPSYYAFIPLILIPAVLYTIPTFLQYILPFGYTEILIASILMSPVVWYLLSCWAFYKPGRKKFLLCIFAINAVIGILVFIAGLPPSPV